MEKYSINSKIIAIIDSGIDKSLIEENISIKSSKHIYVRRNNEVFEIVSEDDDYFDDLHGTLVLKTISRYSNYSNIDCFSYNVFSDGLSSSYSILEALKKCDEIFGLKMIVMSISCSDVLREDFSESLKKLTGKGVKIFSSVKNGSTTSFPANSKYVYGVRGLIYPTKGCYEYCSNREIEFIADHSFEFYRSSNEILVFAGNSKANAIIAGKYILEEDRVFNEEGGKDAISYEQLEKTNEEFVLTDDKLKDELLELTQCTNDNELINYNMIDVLKFEEKIKDYIPDFNLEEVDYINIANTRRVHDYVARKQKAI